MAGIYIHIPFCKQACSYCDFHFSTSIQKKQELVNCLIKEIEIRKNELEKSTIESIYFGGGTPSILSILEINAILKAVFDNYNVKTEAEITLEANPDDLTQQKIIDLAQTKINRLSIGIQSFFEADLKLMNRAHNALEAENCLQIATQYFKNISIDLIYGTPGLTNENWKANIQKALQYNIQHISCYALTVETKTLLEKQVKTGKIAKPSNTQAENQFQIVVNELTKHNFIHYELSNFGKENFFSQNNSAYWLGKKYIGIGPSAHSFNGKIRSWNVANNAIYIKKINSNLLPSEAEVLTISDCYNEYIMTGLRTIWGVSLDKINNDFGKIYADYLLKNCKKHLKNELLIIENNILKTTLKGKFLVDGISSDLFYV